MLLDSDRLMVFQALAMEKNFSRAAERVHRTQPAVSQAIRLLEEEVGERLFVRDGRVTHLTEAGEILLEHVEQVFNVLERGQARIKCLHALREGSLSIGASDTTACYLLPRVLASFRKKYPGVEVRISNRPSPIIAQQVAAREADLGIVTLPIIHPKLESECLTVREDVLICPPNHPLASRKRIQFADILAWPLLLLDQGSNTRSFMDRRLEDARETTGLEPRIAMELGSIEVIKRLVQLDFGISIVPAIAVREEARQGTLKTLRVFAKAECRELGMIYPRGGIVSLAGQVFAKMLKQMIGAKPM